MADITIFPIKDWKFSDAGFTKDEQETYIDEDKQTRNDYQAEGLYHRYDLLDRYCNGEVYEIRLQLGVLHENIYGKEPTDHDLTVRYRFRLESEMDENDYFASIMSYGEDDCECEFDFEKLNENRDLANAEYKRLNQMLFADGMTIETDIENVKDMYDLSMYVSQPDVKLQMLDKFLDRLKDVNKEDYDFFMEHKDLFIEKMKAEKERLDKEKEQEEVER